MSVIKDVVDFHPSSRSVILGLLISGLFWYLFILVTDRTFFLSHELVSEIVPLTIGATIFEGFAFIGLLGFFFRNNDSFKWHDEYSVLFTTLASSISSVSVISMAIELPSLLNISCCMPDSPTNLLEAIAAKRDMDIGIGVALIATLIFLRVSKYFADRKTSTPA